VDSRSVEFVLGHNNVADDEFKVTIGNRSVEPMDAGLSNVAIDDEVGSAAYHTPEGMLLVYDPRETGTERASKDPISTTRLAPTLLALQGVRPPPYMEQPIEQLLEDAL